MYNRGLATFLSYHNWHSSQRNKLVCRFSSKTALKATNKAETFPTARSYGFVSAYAHNTALDQLSRQATRSLPPSRLQARPPTAISIPPATRSRIAVCRKIPSKPKTIVYQSKRGLDEQAFLIETSFVSALG